jgi:dephospho-CoA kinase
MNRKPKCIIVTGRPEAGKTTLAKKLGEVLCMPVISRDQAASFITVIKALRITAPKFDVPTV